MEKSTVLLFTNQTCPHCGRAKSTIENLRKQRNDFDYREMSFANPQTQAMAEKFGVIAVPTFIIQGHGYPEIIGLKGNQDEKVLNKYINKSLGIEEAVENKKSFSEKIKEWLNF